MGYTTEFEGTLQFNKEITEELKNFINKFSASRRMKRDVDKIKESFPDWKNHCYNGNLGTEGEYFVDIECFVRQDESILDFNRPPKTQPGLWCQWIINDDGDLEWDGGEKFYHYEEWLNYLIDNFFEPEGYVLNGIISFQGEDSSDYGDIVVHNNNVMIMYSDEEENGLDDFSDDDLITELKSRGYVVGATV
jgi:hypothetical protein